MVGAGDSRPEQAEDEAPFALTARCIVTVRADGIQLQGPLEAPPFFLGRADLELLAAVDELRARAPDALVKQAIDRAGIAPEDAKLLVRRLRYSRRVDQTPPVVNEAAPDHPALGTWQPFDLDTQGRVALRLPLVLRVSAGRFEIIDHDGRRAAALTAAEVAVLGALRQPVEARAALARACELAGESFDESVFARLLGVLDGAGLLRVVAPTSGDAEAVAVDRDVVIREVFDRHAAAQSAADAELEARTGRHRTKVVPVAFDIGAPAGLGMVIASAKAYDGGRLEEHYNFRTDWVWNDDRLDEFTSEPAIYLFSNYLWSHEKCIAVSQKVKERSPASITIHGGPDTPKYESDARAYFATHPHVDIAIRSEGEVTTAEALAALTSVIGDPTPDLAVLADVPGLTYRDGDRIVRTPDRERISDLNTLPSPFLTGLFDVFTEVPDLFVTIETNRGCPYSCTFCDWGSATASRVRQYDIERVYAELEWCSKMSVPSVSVADANFGMFKRDVEIAQRCADLKVATGYPNAFGVSYAKNTVKHLQHIITVLADAGIMTQGVLSLQTMDQGTLDTIRRSNIKTERYDQLADEMRRAQLPLMVELMMGLPGQSVDSFAGDLQQCIDREVPARINHTTLLVNSPMNDPAYLAEHGIETAAPPQPGLNAIVISTSTFTAEEYGAMEQLRLGYMLYENYGVLRQVSRYVRHETGMLEMDFYRTMRASSEANPNAYPALHALAFFGSAMMTAPYSWALVMDDLRRYVVAELGVTGGSALDAVLRTQRALLPAHGREFPEAVQLPHDVVAWHHAMLAAKSQGYRTDWQDVVPRLGEFGPGELVVDDPNHIAETSLGMNRELNVVGMNWEFDSPLSRARLAATQLRDWLTDVMLPERAQ